MVVGWIEAIRQDNRSGAAELARVAAEQLARWAAGRSPEEIRLAARQLVRAQPRMAPMLHLASAAVAEPQQVARACERFLERLTRGAEAAAASAADLIRHDDVVATHSRSSTVLAALRRAAAQGKRFWVLLTESRPLAEGVTLARELAAAGIPVRLFTDAAVGWIASEARTVLVGADAVTQEAVVNKVGTWPLALAARERAVPAYALATGEKLVPPDYELPPEPMRDPEEILPAAPTGVEVVNRYFEPTPLDLFAGVITEEGILEPDAVRRRLAHLRLPAGLDLP
ncbi:MAG: hypothetical protein RMI94_04230 [Bryobacterales bacterium]|nr:hypothetical protein [Bryobacteraceae bacterium]MDW8129731.1 hypothetical protein [Bryobacterales bacterium]